MVKAYGREWLVESVGRLEVGDGFVEVNKYSEEGVLAGGLVGVKPVRA